MRISLQSLKGLNFLKRKQDLVGVDIGTHSIKVISLKKSGGHWSINRWAVIPYADEIPLDTPLIDRKPQAEAALQQFFKTTEMPSKKAATSVCGNAVIVRYVKMNKMSREDLSKSIRFEAEPYIPFNIDDVNLSFSILGDVFEDGQSQMEAVLVAAKRDAVDVRMDILRGAGLHPVIMDVDAFALENAYENLSASAAIETTMFLNLGANVANMSIVEKGISRVVRDVFIAGNTFTKAIQRQFQCDIRTAEQKKVTFGLVDDGSDPEAAQVVECLMPVARDLITEIQRSIDFYLSQGQDRSVGKIMLCGGTASLRGLDQLISDELKLPVEIFNPLALVENPPTELSEEQKFMMPQMAVAFGLATRRERDDQ